MRLLGYQVVDMIVDHTQTLRDKPVTRTGERRTLAAMVDEAPPE